LIRFLQNISYSLAGKLIGFIALIGFDIVIARRLGVEEYAEWTYFFSLITMLFYVGWLGINAATKISVSKCSDYNEKKCYLKYGFSLRFITSIIIGISLMVALNSIKSYLGFPDKYQSLNLLIMFTGPLIFFNSYTEFYKEVLMGLEKFSRLFLVTIIEYGGYFLFTFCLLLKSTSVVMVAVAYCLSGLLVFVVGLAVLIRECKILKIVDKGFMAKKKYVCDIAKQAIPLFLVGIGIVILIEIDTLMLGMLSSKEEIAIYNIAKSFNSKAAHINYSISVGGMTSFAIVAASQYKEKRKQFNNICTINILITVMVSIILFWVAPLFIEISYGKEYSGAVIVTRNLVPYYCMYAISVFFSTFLDFRGMAKERGGVYIFMITIDVVLNWMLIPLYGANGAAIATTISLAPYTIFVILLTKKEWRNIKMGV